MKLIWVPGYPEPVFTRANEATTLDGLLSSPAQQTELHKSISFAFLTLLEQLTPLERAVFLLRELFNYEYAEIG